MAVVTRTQVATIDQVTAAAHNITGVTIPAGELAVLRFGYQSDTVTISSVTDNAGNTWSVATSVHSGSGDTQTSAIAYLVVPAGGLSGATVTITLSATATLAGHLAYFDSDVGWPSQAGVLDKVSGLNTGLVTAWTSNATVTTTQADELLVGVAYSGGAINGGTSTAGSGWAEENEQALANSGYELVTEWQHVTSASTYAATGTWTAAEIAACCIATFKTAAAAAAGDAPPSNVQILDQAIGQPGVAYFQGYVDPPDVTVAAGVTRDLAALVSGVGSVVANLTVSRALAAVVGGTSSVTPSLRVNRSLSATVAGSSLVQGTLSLIKFLAAAIVGTSTVTVTRLDRSIRVSAAVAGTSTVLAALRLTEALRAAVSGSSVISAALSIFGQVLPPTQTAALLRRRRMGRESGATQPRKRRRW